MPGVTHVLVATDSDQLYAQVDAAVGRAGTRVSLVRAGAEVRAAVIDDPPDLVVVDMQIGSMGGVATILDLRLEEGAGRLDPQRIVLLLDRPADRFLARRSGADAWLDKPIDPFALANLVTELLADGNIAHSG